jgi:hypothetical protein
MESKSPKAVIKYFLDDPEQMRVLKMSLSAEDVYHGLWDIDQALRSAVKYSEGDDFSYNGRNVGTPAELADCIRDELRELVDFELVS